MVRMTRLFKDHREAGHLNELVNIHAALGEHTFATKNDEVFSVFGIGGIDPEGLGPEHLDAHCRLFQTALRAMEGGRLYQYVIKSDLREIPSQRYPEKSALNAAVENRAAFFASKARPLSEVRLYGALVWPAGLKRSRAWREALLTETRRSHDVSALQNACLDLGQRLHTFSAQLSDSAKPTVLGKDEAFRFLRHLLTLGGPTAAATLKHDQFIDFQLCGAALECHPGFLRLGTRHVKVLSLKEPPTRSSAHLLGALLKIPAEFVIASEWKPESNETVRRLIQSKRRHFHNKRSSPLAFLTTSEGTESGVLIDDSATAQVRVLGECLEELEVRGNGFGLYSLTLVLHDEDPERLKSAVAECCKVFATHDAQLIVEHYNVLNAYLSILPGGHLFNRRRLWLSHTNHADLSFLFRLDEGDRRSPHLHAEYVASFETNHGTPYYFNFHCQDVGHTLVLGATGSGKSFLLNFLLTHAQKYDPHVCIFDIGGSYAKLTRLAGGTYLPVAAANWPFSINPFVLPPTPENLQFLLRLVVVLATSNGYAPSAADEKDIFEQITNLYEIDPSERRLATLVHILSRPLRLQLEKWIRPGPYGALFDNAQDTLSFSRFQTFDFEGLIDSPMLEPFLFYVLHRASAAILNQSDITGFKLFCLDEVWRFLQHPTIRQYVLEALKTWRKKNAAVILATQSLADLLHSEMLDVVVESCPTKLFLANPEMDKEAYRSRFHLNETEADLIAGLIPKRQFLLKRPNLAKVLNLEVDSASYWLYTSSPHDHAKQQEAFERLGFEEGLHFLARSHA